ncbi:hypothetical protein GYMLUDRAFT_697395 [Collybiopsis luxurians FD-317 M1]|uniref:Unplaced genomic scaffold GYMLUscaffold_38, whole genome shotgun sequence n=1 Tax=Collybiopsis luxurians FD-317 M1 TaxID=944289 RepID=A0A0D0C6K0_9AGAR|nr:hypothetical protein GYMLUDRAFT_697395 [Collybiopsis luxurians FD-317 M1]
MMVDSKKKNYIQRDMMIDSADSDIRWIAICYLDLCRYLTGLLIIIVTVSKALFFPSPAPASPMICHSNFRLNNFGGPDRRMPANLMQTPIRKDTANHESLKLRSHRSCPRKSLITEASCSHMSQGGDNLCKSRVLEKLSSREFFSLFFPTASYFPTSSDELQRSFALEPFGGQQLFFTLIFKIIEQAACL